MPRKCKVPKDVLISLFMQYKDQIKLNFGKSTAKVWVNISNSVDGKISAQGIYTIIRTNRYNCLHQLGIEKHEVSSETDSTVHLDENSLCSIFESETFFTLEYNTWVSLINKNENSLEPRWTHVFFEHISKQLDLNCVLMFKRYKLCTSYGHYYFTFNAYCSECNPNLKGWLPREPARNKLLKIYCSISGYNNNLHTFDKKRPLSGVRRNEVGQRLCDEKLCVTWKREEVLKQGPRSRTLYSLDALRKCKQDIHGKTQYNTIDHNDSPISSLVKMKYDEKFSCSLKKIGCDPFMVLYWTADQLRIYNDYIKRCENSTLIIDATGSLCKKITRPNYNTSANIFLYQAVIHLGTANGQIPISQMLSEVHDITTISFWLSNWQKEAKVPHIVVTDHSLALLGSIARTIGNEPDLSTYIDKCFKILCRQEKSVLKTYIRVDFAHVMKLLSRWNCFKSKPGPVKQFYLKAMARLVKCSDFEVAQIIVKHILVVANSYYEGYDESMKPFPSEISKIYLKKLISGLDEVIIDDTHNDVEEYNCDTEHESSTNYLISTVNNSELHYIKKWILSFENNYKVNTNSSGSINERENFYYLPEFSKSFLKFLRTYPLWSAVMNSYFKVNILSASSSSVESYFNDLKHRSFHSEKLPIRADKFVSRHLGEIDAMLLLCENQDVTEEKISSIQISPLRLINEDTFENWRGLGNIKKKIKIDSPNCEEDIIVSKAVNNERKSTYLKSKRKPRSSFYSAPNPEILYLNAQKKIEIPLLKNGNICKPINFEMNLIRLTNTCAFDSIIQCFASAFCDSTLYNNEISSNNRLYPLLQSLIEDGAEKMYLQRAKLLYPLAKKSVALDKKCLTYDCEFNIISAFERCLNLYSAVESYTCIKCRYYHEYKKKTIVTSKENIPSLEKILKKNIDLKCRMCSFSINLQINFASQIFIDTDESEGMPLDTIPFLINLGKSYILRGAIAFNKPATRNGLGHYYALCRRNDSTWELYNDLNKRIKIIKNHESHNIHAILYTI